MTSSDVARPTRPRIDGLDAWRVALMLGGFLLHASYWLPAQPLFTAIGVISHLFRMGCFFAISGFLCGLSMQKRSAPAWLMRRVGQIGPPMLFGWGMLCPLIAVISHWYPGVATPLIFDWHHVWFLIALLIYAPIGAFFDEIDRSHHIVDRIARVYCARRSLLLLLLSVGAVSFVLTAGTEMLVAPFESTAFASMLSETHNMAGCLPDYLLGLAMARSDVLASAIQRSWRSALAIVMAAGSLYLLYILVAPVLGPLARVNMGDLVAAIAACVCPPAVFALIFRSAVRIRSLPPFVRHLCGASLTIYLLHLPLLLIVNVALTPMALGPYWQFAAAIVVAALLSYAAHVWLIRPFPMLRWLVNGHIDLRLSGRSDASSAQTVPSRPIEIDGANRR